MSAVPPTATAIDIDHLREWVGRQQIAEQRIDPFPARALAGLLDRAQAPEAGDALPLPWHWLYFLDTPARAAIGIDGHPGRGGFLPPVPLPRRMWASGEIDVEAPLTIGRDAQKVSTVQSVELKQGQSGALVFVTVEHVLSQAGRTCLRERQHIVYRDAPIGAAPLPPGSPPKDEARWQRALQPDPAMLFRYSALTYNGHRIHYDRDYATRQEFYPALVVHGPLLATLLLDLLQTERPESPIAHFDFRALRPAFDADLLTLQGRAGDDGRSARLWTVDPQGAQGMGANVRFA
ncbi:MaoC family dehydratase N-terminal domain-containing protein [soil metagenome]